MSLKAVIPYGAYWSTPFARWQGAFAHLHSVEFAAHVTRRELAQRKIDPAGFDFTTFKTATEQLAEQALLALKEH